MNLIEIIFLAGTQCISPLQASDGVTEVNKVACAVVVKQDPQTAAVEVFPTTAATDPGVIAVLGKTILDPPPPTSVTRFIPAASDSKVVIWPASNDGAVVEQVTKAAAAPVAKVRKVKRQKSQEAVGLTVNRKKTAVRKVKDQCGSYRAVWYTNKEGRRKYRCVRS